MEASEPASTLGPGTAGLGGVSGVPTQGTGFAPGTVPIR